MFMLVIRNPEPVKIFAELLTQIDVKLPVTLKNLTGEYNYTFNCETNDGKMLNITLKFGDGWDSPDEMQIEYKGKTSIYTYSSNRIKLTLETKTILKDDVKLYNFYCDFFCHRILTLPDNYEFKLEVNEEPQSNNTQFHVLQNAEAVENYILSLASTPIYSFYTVYERIKECYQLDNDLIKKMKYFKMVLSQKNNDKTSKITRAFVIYYGQLQEYTETQNGVTIYWSRNGDWKYQTPNILVSFDQKSQKPTVSIICEPEVIVVNISSIIELIETTVRKTIDTIIIP